MRILLIEDSKRLRELVSEALRAAGWQVDSFESGGEGEAALAVAEYDLLVLDLGLPDTDGLEVLRRLRGSGSRIPVLVLTARGAVDERIEGLDAGADDYLVKPFNNGELTARLRALSRRSPNTVMPELRVGAVVLPLSGTPASCDGIMLDLSPRERELLELLMRNAGSVVSKRKIEHSFSEFGDESSANAVELTLSRLRKRLDGVTTGFTIETIRGVGYMLREAQ
ncbi:DNA-binding response regulator [Devosia pacifica]|uniref:DNA-binding response regulator n=1 Tax=Devosia pacifica TaxID=1335967 RepID=A0A918S2T6_9HYPH|nr:response regulator transcription factor [Devosia pacifica]GHA21625.1 DNA-binding response regulator [Devosia pacifica]